MKLHPAYSLAEKIVAQLAPMCERIDIAGSVRRARPVVNDIDLVILPKAGQLDAIKARCAQRSRVVRDGQQNCIYALRLGAEEFQLDVFFARPASRDLLEAKPGNYGTLLLCRTGSKEHNIKLCQLAKERDMKWNPYEGVLAGGRWAELADGSEYIGGQVIASETEGDIFKALGVPFVSPALREIGAPQMDGGPEINPTAQPEGQSHE